RVPKVRLIKKHKIDLKTKGYFRSVHQTQVQTLP
ncbi:MAG: hypothetical protein ACI94D_001517, partial [Neolewinella sp.]